MAKVPDKETLMLPGPAGSLEALLESPVDSSYEQVAVLCHPHPQFQGTMQNKVVHTLARSMNDLGVPALRFNFRGVGQSAGEYADGDGEVEDLVAVVDYVRERWPDAAIWLAGFSFGGVIAARAAARVRPERLVSIAPAVNILGEKLDATPAMPWLIVQGDADDVVPADAVQAFVANLQPQPKLVILPGAGHFFHGHLVQLRQLLNELISE